MEKTLDMAWEYVRSVTMMTRATGGSLHNNYFVNSALDSLGKAEVLFSDHINEGQEVNEDYFNELIDDTLQSLDVVNNRLRSA